MKNWFLSFLLFGFCSASPTSVGLDHTIENPKLDLSLLVTNSENETLPLQELVLEKPLVIGFVYYGCASMCTFFLNGLLSTLERSPPDYLPGKEYHLAILSIDPAENSTLAKAKKEAVFKKLKAKISNEEWSFLVADSSVIDSLTQSVGFSFQKTVGGYAHTSALFIVNKEGTVSKILEGQSFFPMEIQLGVQVAKAGKFSPIVKRFVEFCFVKDPTGKSYYFDFLKVIGVLILLLIVTTVFLLGRLIHKKKSIQKVTDNV